MSLMSLVTTLHHHVARLPSVEAYGLKPSWESAMGTTTRRKKCDLLIAFCFLRTVTSTSFPGAFLAPRRREEGSPGNEVESDVARFQTECRNCCSFVFNVLRLTLKTRLITMVNSFPLWKSASFFFLSSWQNKRVWGFLSDLATTRIQTPVVTWYVRPAESMNLPIWSMYVACNPTNEELLFTITTRILARSLANLFPICGQTHL